MTDPHLSLGRPGPTPPADPPMDLGEPRLSETELIVVRALTEREKEAEFPRVANAYRRLVANVEGLE